ncbi:hypothetical protein K469DRAFT_730570 [Zopfia rhizophila CBS 207.26]|uniref:Xaa-Pro dipeptidyl-peptidase C-terminal domain-containing protein n=1 Tax=Zopfia rhizophila CBS 207.26 TaxID=1314779 RepID=A0A6A6DPG8_9PEZI|nr:hypothetical protein K469DRAFT_730570 [Zopfia rhizophila CBS 207.26]
MTVFRRLLSLIGHFLDVNGLSYSCGTIESTLKTHSAYSYEPGATVSFRVGTLVVGESIGKPLMTTSDLLSPGQGFELPITIDANVGEVLNAITKYVSEINLDAQNESDLDHVLSKICGELAGSPKSVPHTRNHLRRTAAGFKVMRDIRIAVKDGDYVLGDAYLPLEHGKRCLVLLSCTIYGKRVVASGPNLQIGKDIAKFEKYEDNWHSTTVDVELLLSNRGPWFSTWTNKRAFENIATFNSFTCVPRGYPMIKIDPRGVLQTPGTRGWAGEQSWSDGNVALVGSSDVANMQWGTALMKSKSLRCDIDMYRDAAYSGGIPLTRFVSQWRDRVQKVSPKWENHSDLSRMIAAYPFLVPMAVSQIFIIHGRGADSQDLERVGIQMRMGNRQRYWRTESTWPVPIPQYTQRYLRNNETLSGGVEKEPERRVAYSTKIPPSGNRSDVEFAGHFTATLSISSSTPDADVVVSLWVTDGQGKVVPFGAHGQPEPLAKSFLRARYRKLDTPPERPWHTHRLEDNAPLNVDEVVVVEVGIFPAAARVQEGWKLRLDITPSEDQPDIPRYNPPR